MADGLDEGNWQILCDAVAAGYRGDVNAAGTATRRFDTDVAVDAQAGLYLRYLIWYRLAGMLGSAPTAEDLNELAARFYPRFAAVVRGQVTLLQTPGAQRAGSPRTTRKSPAASSSRLASLLSAFCWTTVRPTCST